MLRALELAQQGACTCMPNPRVGCVIVKDGHVVGEGWHKQAGAEHAEIVALRQAGVAARNADLYVTLEPCSHTGRTPPCTDAIVTAGIATVTTAMPDPDPRVNGSGIARLQAAEVRCETGLLAEAAAWLNRGFVSRVKRARPWLCVKTASSMDGKVAQSNGTSKWITSTAARREAHLLRAESCAVLTSSNTALADNPQLTAREVDAPRQPLRVLVDSQGRCPPTLAMFVGGPVVVATVAAAQHNYPENVRLLRLPESDGRVDLPALLSELAQAYQINFLLVECGAVLAGALLRESLVDEIVAFIAPRYLGGGKTVASFEQDAPLSEAADFKVRSLRQVGPDVCINLQRS